nr:Chain B, Oligopeptide [synthetic construct]
SLSQLSSQS